MSEVTKEVLDGLQNTFSTKAEVTAHIESIKSDLSASADQLQKLENILVEQGNQLNEVKNANTASASNISIGEQIEKMLSEDGGKMLKDVKNKKEQHRFELALKSAGDMTISTNVTGSTTLLPYPQLIPGYNPYKWNPATYLDYASIGTTTSARIAWVDEVSPDGAATAVSEAAVKPQIDKDDKVSVSDAVKIAAIVRISDEMLDDISFMGTQINQRLLGEIRRVSSSNIYTYIDSVNALTAVDSNLAGMGGSSANIWQLVVAAKQTLALGNHTCTHVFLNPVDYARLLLLKGDDQAPIIIQAGETTIHGVTVVSSNAQAIDTYLAADYSKLNVAAYKNLAVEMGWNGDDFKYNMRTFRAEWRFHRYIMENDKAAFLIGGVSTDLTTLSI